MDNETIAGLHKLADQKTADARTGGPCHHIAGVTCPNCRPVLTSPSCPHCVPRCPHGYPVYPQPYGVTWRINSNPTPFTYTTTGSTTTTC